MPSTATRVDSTDSLPTPLSSSAPPAAATSTDAAADVVLTADLPWRAISGADAAPAAQPKFSAGETRGGATDADADAQAARAAIEAAVPTIATPARLCRDKFGSIHGLWGPSASECRVLCTWDNSFSRFRAKQLTYAVRMFLLSDAAADEDADAHVDASAVEQLEAATELAAVEAEILAAEAEEAADETENGVMM